MFRFDIDDSALSQPDCPQIQKVVVKQKVKVINAKGDVNVKQNIAVNQEQTKQSAPGSKRAESPATEELIEDDSEAAYSGTTEAEDPKRVSSFVPPFFFARTLIALAAKEMSQASAEGRRRSDR